MAREGCPLCLVTREAMERVMDTWQYEGFSDVEQRQALVRARGFCPRHTWQLAQLPTSFQLALLYRETLPEILADMQRHLQQIQGHQRTRSGFFRRVFGKQRRRQPGRKNGEPLFLNCPLCQRQAEIEQRLASAWLTMLSVEDLRSRMSQANGLCLPHFTRVSVEASNNTQRAVLLECQATCVQRTLDEIEELVRKHDYRFLQEPRGEEMTSWRRAAQLFVGNN